MMHACFDDIEPILDLLQEGHDRSPTYRHLPTNRDKARLSLQQMILNPTMLVAYHGDGVLIGLASQAWWHDGMVIADLFCYARRRGLALVRAYLAWAKEFPGENEITLGVTFGGAAGERTEKFYQRLGLERSGAIFRVAT